MRRIVRNLAGAVLVTAAAALAAGAAGAAPWRIVSDAPDSVWVLDAASGALLWCRLEAPSGPKVLDLFGSLAEPRPATPRRALPECADLRAGARVRPPAEALLALGTDDPAGAAAAPETSDGAAGVRPRILTLN